FWVAIGRFFGWFRGRNLVIAAAVALGVTAAGSALALVPWDYRVEGLGKTMPVIQREVFAPWDGDVVAIHVESGERVKKGDTLLQLESDDLRAELTSQEAELELKRGLLESLKTQ